MAAIHNFHNSSKQFLAAVPSGFHCLKLPLLFSSGKKKSSAVSAVLIEALQKQKKKHGEYCFMH